MENNNNQLPENLEEVEKTTEEWLNSSREAEQPLTPQAPIVPPTVETPVAQTPPAYTPPVAQAPPAYTPPVAQTPPAYTPPVQQTPPTYTPPVQQTPPAYTPPVQQTPPGYSPLPPQAPQGGYNTVPNAYGATPAGSIPQMPANAGAAQAPYPNQAMPGTSPSWMPPVAQPQAKKGGPIGIIIGVVVAIVVAAGVFLFLNSGKKTPPIEVSSSSVGESSSSTGGNAGTTLPGSATEIQLINDMIDGFENAKLDSYLADNPTQLNFMDSNTWAPIYRAVYSENYDAIPILISHGADIEYIEEQLEYNSPLDCAVTYGDNEAVKVLIANGANANVKTFGGTPVLLRSTSRTDTVMLKALLDAGADPKATTSYGANLMHIVARSANQEAYDIVLALGVDESVKDMDGMNVGHYAFWSGDVEWAKKIAVRGFNFTDPLESNLTLYHYAASAEAVKYIQENLNLDINQASDYGEYPITNMAPLSRPGLIEAMIAAGADVNVKDSKGMTALMYAAKEVYFTNDTTIIKALFDAGADITATDSNGMTAYDYYMYYNPTTDIPWLKP